MALLQLRVEQQEKWEGWVAGQRWAGAGAGRGEQAQQRPLVAKGTVNRTWQWWEPTGPLRLLWQARRLVSQLWGRQ